MSELTIKQAIDLNNYTEITNSTKYIKCPDECRYYGSDLNKYIHEELTNEMTCINVDCLQYKRAARTLRTIESKHDCEDMKYGQKEALNLLGLFSNIINRSTKIHGYKYYAYKATGNYPYETNGLSVINLADNERRTLFGQDVRDFLEFKFEIIKSLVPNGEGATYKSAPSTSGERSRGADIKKTAWQGDGKAVRPERTPERTNAFSAMSA